MKEDFLAELIDSPARARVTRALMFNQAEIFSVAKLARISGVNSKSVIKEIKDLEKMGIIKKGKMAKGRKVRNKERPEAVWVVNKEFKYLRALSAFIHAVFPIRYANIVNALKSSGKLSAVVVSGCFMGDLTRPVDMIVVGDTMNEGRLERAIKTLEPLFGREIRYASFLTPEFRYRLTIQDRLIRDTLDYPHLALLDRTRLL